MLKVRDLPVYWYAKDLDLPVNWYAKGIDLPLCQLVGPTDVAPPSPEAESQSQGPGQDLKQLTGHRFAYGSIGTHSSLSYTVQS